MTSTAERRSSLALLHRRRPVFLRQQPCVLAASGIEHNYSWTPDRVMHSDAKPRLECSLARDVHALRGEHDAIAAHG